MVIFFFLRLMTQRIKSKSKKAATLEGNAKPAFRHIEFTV